MIMRTMIFLLLLALVLMMRGTWHRTECIGGVSYLRFVDGVTVEYLPGGRIKTCSEPMP